MFGRRPTDTKTPEQILLMRAAGLVVGETLELLAARVTQGITTGELDRLAEEHIRSRGARPSFAEVPGYRHTLCVSVNDEVVHGIPGDRVLVDGDLVSIDAGAVLDGWHGDAAISLVVGTPEAGSAADLALVDATEASLWSGIAALRVGSPLHDVGAAVEDTIMAAARSDGVRYGILEDYVGHGIGTSMHEAPQVPNYRVRGKGPTVRPGLTIAIEPMVTLGSEQTRVLDDEWTVVTVDGSRGAHWEHSVAVSQEGVWVLTAVDGGEKRLTEMGVRFAPVA
jgi:methionyl aminopeptidase